MGENADYSELALILKRTLEGAFQVREFQKNNDPKNQVGKLQENNNPKTPMVEIIV